MRVEKHTNLLPIEFIGTSHNSVHTMISGETSLIAVISMTNILSVWGGVREYLLLAVNKCLPQPQK